MDILSLEGIESSIIIGDLPFEREYKQRIVVSLELGFDFDPVISSDALADTLDYVDIVEQVKAYMEASSFFMIEALAGGIISFLFDRYSSLLEVAIRLEKPGVFQGGVGVSCTLSRSRS